MFAVSALLFTTTNVLEDSRRNWLSVEDEAHEKFLLLASLQDAVGYGGLVHNFKNYVLRGEPAYRDLVKQDFKRIDELLARYRARDLTPDEKFALRQIDTVFREYREKFTIAEGMIGHGVRAENIDDVVRVDDTPAQGGFAILLEAWQARAGPIQHGMDDSIQRGVDSIRYVYMVIPVILLAAVLVLWLVGMLMREIALSEAEERRARDNEAKFRNLILGSLQGVMILQNGRIVFANEALAEMFGFASVDEVMGIDFYRDLVPEEDSEAVAAVRAELLSGQRDSYAYRARRQRKDGSQIWVDVTVHGVEWEGEKAFQILYIDVSEQVRSEQELIAEKERVEKHATAMAELNENLHFARMEAEEKQRELHALSITDPLTGAFNRRHFLERGHEEVRRMRRFGNPIAVLMLDIDHFKKINDTHGHAAGDLALLRLTEEAHKLLREVDVFGRLGGEEFAVILPDTEQEPALIVAERLRRTLARTRIDTENDQLRFTVSIGVALVGEDDGNIEAALNRADKALYAAKAGGRDRVVVYEPDLPTAAEA